MKNDNPIFPGAISFDFIKLVKIGPNFSPEWVLTLIRDSKWGEMGVGRVGPVFATLDAAKRYCRERGVKTGRNRTGKQS